MHCIELRRHIPSPSGGGLGWGRPPTANDTPPRQPQNPIPTLTPNPSPAPTQNGGKWREKQNSPPPATHPAATQPQPRAVKAQNHNPMPYIHHTDQTRQTPPLSSRAYRRTKEANPNAKHRHRLPLTQNTRILSPPYTPPPPHPTHPYYPLQSHPHQIPIPSPSGGGIGWGRTPHPQLMPPPLANPETPSLQ